MGGGFPGFYQPQFQNPQDKSDYDLYYSGMSDQQKMQEMFRGYSFGGGAGMFGPMMAAQNAVQQGRAKRQSNEQAAAQQAAAEQAAAQKAASDKAAADKAAADKAAADKTAKEASAMAGFNNSLPSALTSTNAGSQLIGGGAGADSLAPKQGSGFIKDDMPERGKELAGIFSDAVSVGRNGVSGRNIY